MSSEEFPTVPTRPQRHTHSPSPSPMVPTRPASKSPVESSVPQIPTKRPSRSKTAELDDLMQSTDKQLKEMHGVIHKRTIDSRNQFQELKGQEDRLQSGIEELLAQPGSNVKEQELQEEKERLLRRREAMLAERKKQQLAREEELKVLERRREELVSEREKEKELERVAEEELRKQQEEELERERKLKREKELEAAKELQRCKDMERQKELERQLRERKEQEITRQKKLEFEERRQQELDKKQEEQLEAKKRELELLEKEQHLAEKKEKPLELQKNRFEIAEVEKKGYDSSDADKVFLETVSKDFGLKSSKPETFPQMPERPERPERPRGPNMSSRASISEHEQFEKSSTPGPGQARSEQKPESGSSDDIKLESDEMPNVPERPSVGAKTASSDSPLPLQGRTTSASDREPDSPSIPERPIVAKKTSSFESSGSSQKPEVTEKTSDIPSVPQRPKYDIKKPSNEFPSIPEKRPSERKSESPSFSETQNVTASESPIVPEQRPGEKKPELPSFSNIQNITASESPIVPEERPGSIPTDKEPIEGRQSLSEHSTISSDSENKNSVSSDLHAIPGKRPVIGIKKSASPTASLPRNEQKPEKLSDDSKTDTARKELDTSGEVEHELQSRSETPKSPIESSDAPDDQEFDNKRTEPLPSGSSETKSESKKATELPSHNLSEQKPEESKVGESFNELSKKKLPPVPKKPSSRIFAFQEMLRKQQMEGMQNSRNQGPELTAAKSNDSSEPPQQPSVPQRPHRPVNEERSKFASNLNGLFALPGMSPMGGGLPPSFAKKIGPPSTQDSHQEERKDTKSIPNVRPARARGPRGRKLPTNVASVEKVGSENKTNEIEIFQTWKTVMSKQQAPPTQTTQDGTQKSDSLERVDEKSPVDDNETTGAIEVTDPTYFDLDDKKAVKPVEQLNDIQDDEPLDSSNFDENIRFAATAENEVSVPNEQNDTELPSFFSSTAEPVPATTFSFQDSPGDSRKSSVADLQSSGGRSDGSQQHTDSESKRSLENVDQDFEAAATIEEENEA